MELEFSVAGFIFTCSKTFLWPSYGGGAIAPITRYRSTTDGSMCLSAGRPHVAATTDVRRWIPSSASCPSTPPANNTRLPCTYHSCGLPATEPTCVKDCQEHQELPPVLPVKNSHSNSTKVFVIRFAEQ